MNKIKFITALSVIFLIATLNCVYANEAENNQEDVTVLTKKEEKALKKQKKNQAKASKYVEKERKWLIKQKKNEDESKKKEEERKEKLQNEQKKLDSETELVDGVLINKKTGFPAIIQRPYVTFDEGITFDMITRLQKQDKNNRSDFVWQNYLAGAYFTVKSENIKPFNEMIRVSAYYPFYYTYNGMEQIAKQTILYAFDLFAGPAFQLDMWKYVQLNLAGGLHYMYQLSDEYHLNYLGAGILGGIELPIAQRWTIVNNGTFTLDYANLGTNKTVQPFDYSWSYQVSLGVRYSKKKLHKYAYIHHIEKSKNTKEKDSEN